MDFSLISFAIAAGLVAALNPCGFAMLPAYLTLVVLGDERTENVSRSNSAAVGRALLATVLMALGFLLVFGTFGLIVAPLASSLQRYVPSVTVVIGAGMLALGIWMLTGRELTVLLPKPGRGAPTRRLGSMFGYGVAYAVASLSCTIGPFLGVTSATFGTGSIAAGVTAYLGYGFGMTLVVGVLAVVVALAGSAVANRARRLLPYVTRIGGGLLVLMGLYVGYYGVYELRLYFGGGSARDPVVSAAVAVQQVLVGWVDSAGVLAMAGVLGILIAVVVVLHRRKAGHQRGQDRDQAPAGADNDRGIPRLLEMLRRPR